MKEKTENDITDKRKKNEISKVKCRGGKTRMKRAAACLLALCLVVQGPASLMTSFADFGQRGVASPSNSVSASPSETGKEKYSDNKNG